MASSAPFLETAAWLKQGYTHHLDLASRGNGAQKPEVYKAPLTPGQAPWGKTSTSGKMADGSSLTAALWKSYDELVAKKA